MAITRHWLKSPYALEGESSGVCIVSSGLIKHCPSSKANTLREFLPAFTIAYSQPVPISAGVLSTSG